jgi:hypothetical protein
MSDEVPNITEFKDTKDSDRLNNREPDDTARKISFTTRRKINNTNESSTKKARNWTYGVTKQWYLYFMAEGNGRWQNGCTNDCRIVTGRGVGPLMDLRI